MYKEIKELTKKMVQTASVNATAGERAIADFIVNYLQEIPYFQQHPDFIITQELHNDSLHRQNVFALLKGGNQTLSDTIVLHGHTDTVDVDDFGKYKSYAFDCDALAKVFVDADLPDDARRDLESGNYLFGRGVCDMKGGVAVFMVLLKHLAENPSALHGNILLSCNPVEETLHQGIIEGLPLLLDLQEKQGLQYKLAINNDFICPMYAGDTARYVYTGAVGKLLPMFYVLGRETHVAQCFEGFSPDLVAAKLTEMIDRNPAFCDGYQGEFSLPPTVLKMQDLKERYNVQTPHTAAVYFNYFVHNRQTSDIVEHLKQTAQQAMIDVMTLADTRYQAYCALSGKQYTSLMEPLQVLTYQELYAMAQTLDIGDLDAWIAKEVHKCQDMDKRLVSLHIVQALCDMCGIKTPTTVLFFATPFCPHNTLKSEVPEEQQVIAEISKIATAFGQEYGEDMQLQQFFPSLTDSSYLKIDDDDASVAMLQENFPGYDLLYPVPLQTAKKLNIPSVNYGVWGKDCHKWTERLYMPYSFGKLPQFVLKTINYYFGEDKENL